MDSNLGPEVQWDPLFTFCVDVYYLRMPFNVYKPHAWDAFLIAHICIVYSTPNCFVLKIIAKFLEISPLSDKKKEPYISCADTCHWNNFTCEDKYN